MTSDKAKFEIAMTLHGYCSFFIEFSLSSISWGRFITVIAKSLSVETHFCECVCYSLKVETALISDCSSLTSLTRIEPGLRMLISFCAHQKLFSCGGRSGCAWINIVPIILCARALAMLPYLALCELHRTGHFLLGAKGVTCYCALDVEIDAVWLWIFSNKKKTAFIDRILAISKVSSAVAGYSSARCSRFSRIFPIISKTL